MEYRRFTQPAEAHKAYNSLYGIVKGILADKEVTEEEKAELKLWIAHHSHLAKKDPFKEVIAGVERHFKYCSSDTEEDLFWLLDKLGQDFTYYKRETSAFQRLAGICHGILADGTLKDEEVHMLNDWLTTNASLNSLWPYDEVVSHVTNVLADQVITDEERKQLIGHLSSLCSIYDEQTAAKLHAAAEDSPLLNYLAVDPHISFEGKRFCITGESTSYTQAELAAMLINLGAEVTTSVSRKTDYLIVCDGKNPCWSYACYGRKVEKAMQLRKQGIQVMLVHENDLLDAVRDY